MIVPIAILLLIVAAAGIWLWGRPPIKYPPPEALIIPPEGDFSDGERLPRFDSIPNFRDLGGYRSADGRRVRWRRVYRSGAFSHPSAADLTRLAALELRFVCDLRSVEEVESDPDVLPTNPVPNYLHLPLYDRHDRARRLRALLNRRSVAQLVPEAYIEVMIEENAPLMGEVLRRLADPANLPAVVHCTAGKDRTGVASALLLLLLGVPEATVIADYSLSNHFFDDFRRYTEAAIQPFRKFGVNMDDVTPLLLADPANLRLTLAHIRTKYGSVEAYLRNRAGLDDSVIAALKANLLE